MAIVVYTSIAMAALLWGWFALLASRALQRDITLETSQKAAQLLLAWLLPWVGAIIVLRLIWQNDPEALQGRLPWLLRYLIGGKAISPNTQRDDDEWLASFGVQHHPYDGIESDGGGYDGGGYGGGGCDGGGGGGDA